MRSIIHLSIKFRMLVTALAVGLIALGIMRLPAMHVDVLPETSPVVVDVQTEALGLSAPEVEELVTVPLEKNLFDGIMGVVDETSDSIPGLSNIELHFAPGTDLYHARQLVQERLNQAFVLPNVSSPPTMVQPVSTTSDVMLVGLTSKSMNLIDMSVLSRWTIVPKLLGLAGVANVSTFGQSDRQLQVMVDPAKMAADGVALTRSSSPRSATCRGPPRVPAATSRTATSGSTSGTSSRSARPPTWPGRRSSPGSPSATSRRW